MYTAGDSHATLIRLMHRAGRGESVISDLNDEMVRLEQARSFRPLPDWRQSIIDIRGSLMTHFVGPLSTNVERMNDPVEMRKVYFAEAAADRLSTLMAQVA